MVAKVKCSRSTKKPASKAKQSRKKLYVCSTVVAVLVTLFGGFVYQLYLAKQQRIATHAAKISKVVEVKKPTPPTTTYEYTKILESKEIDTGSGVRITRNYEAEKIAKENEYRRAQAEKRRKIKEAREAKERQIAEKKRLAAERKLLADQKRRAEAEQKRLLAEQKRLTAEQRRTQQAMPQIKTAQQTLASGKKYLNCSNDNYRTIKEAEAQKAKLAFMGKESQVIVKTMGGGSVYSLAIGPYNTVEEANNARISLQKAKIANKCTVQ